MKKQRLLLCRSALLPLLLLGLSDAVCAQTTLFDFNTVNTIPYAGLTEIAPGQFIGIGSHYPTGPGGSQDLVIYKLTGAGVYSQIYDFGGGDCFSAGHAPIQALDGNLWGSVLEFCKTRGQSFIYRLSPDGSNIWFPYTTRSNILGPFTEGPRGFLYGANQNGGTGYGSIFRISLSGVYQTVWEFGLTDGNGPNSALVQTPDGSLWGTTQGGGLSNEGILFRIEPDGTFVTEYSFTGIDVRPGALVLAPNGLLYGTTLEGGSNYSGSIFSFNPASSTFTTLYNFGGSYLEPGGVGQEPSPLEVLPDGRLAGIIGAANQGWNTLFVFNPASSSITFTTPPQIANGSGYGYLIQTVQSGLIGLDEGGSTNGLAYKVSEPAPPPVVSVLPPSANIGRDFYVTGNYLLDAVSVSLNGTPLAFQVRSVNSIRVTPPGSPATGFLTVTTPNGVATSQTTITVEF